MGWLRLIGQSENELAKIILPVLSNQHRAGRFNALHDDQLLPISEETRSTETLRAAVEMLKDSESYESISDIIEQLGVERTTFYRHFSPDHIHELHR